MTRLLPIALVLCAGPVGLTVAQDSVLTGPAAFGGWRDDAPGVMRKIVPEDLPSPDEASSTANRALPVARPEGAQPMVPEGYSAALIAEGLDIPRTLVFAPNGDLFVAESGSGVIRVMRFDAGQVEPVANEVFVDGLTRPYGIAFYPPENPEWIYVGETDALVRIPYRPGEMAAAGPAEELAALPTGGHWTRDVAVSPDGQTIFVSVGSDSNVGVGVMDAQPPGGLAAWQAAQPLGTAWGEEEERATLLAFAPDGSERRIYATGLRNCSGLAIAPSTGMPWCAVNERDGIGGDLPPDYATAVEEGAFYGWPWFYIGGHPDPRWAEAPRSDLAGAVTVPDVLLQAHSAPLGITFAPEGTSYAGDAFVALHGSWNRGTRTGYKVVRLPFENGQPTGAYEDFVTGMVLSDEAVWARPVGVAFAPDGTLYFSEDGNGSIWSVSPN
jgi:glucose/arabinose dehydrogenase